MNNINKIIKSNNLKINDIIKTANVSRTQFYDIRTGKVTPSVRVATRIAQTLNTTIDELFPK